MTGRELYLSSFCDSTRTQRSVLLFSSVHFSRFLSSPHPVFISLQHDIHCVWSDLSCNLNYGVRPSLVNRFSSFLRLCVQRRGRSLHESSAVSWLGWCWMMHCDDLAEGEQGSLAHKSPLRLLGVSAWPVNLMIEKQALGQTARPLTVAL